MRGKYENAAFWRSNVVRVPDKILAKHDRYLAGDNATHAGEKNFLRIGGGHLARLAKVYHGQVN